MCQAVEPQGRSQLRRSGAKTSGQVVRVLECNLGRLSLGIRQAQEQVAPHHQEDGRQDPFRSADLERFVDHRHGFLWPIRLNVCACLHEADQRPEHWRSSEALIEIQAGPDPLQTLLGLAQRAGGRPEQDRSESPPDREIVRINDAQKAECAILHEAWLQTPEVQKA